MDESHSDYQARYALEEFDLYRAARPFRRGEYMPIRQLPNEELIASARR